MSDKIPIDKTALTELMNRPIIIRIVSVYLGYHKPLDSRAP